LFVSAAVLHPGDLLGERYEILELLGEGGMGAVYKARDHELGRFVALKVIRPELASSPAILARFKQELLLAHQVTHKNVIRIYDLAEAEGLKFITMEFIEGMDLRRILLERGKFSPQDAVDIIRQVCLALDAAHGVGVIHRDLKPQNIMQDYQGRVVVMDFGLARSVESEGMTQTGALVGTMEYMSPEQALGQALDQRSDLFAVGLIFFELLTGKMPYKAETALASLLLRSRERAVSAYNLDPNVPRSLSSIVSKCLERDVNFRYRNVQEILRDLEAWKSMRPVSTRKLSLKRVHNLRWKWAATVALIMLVASTTWYLGPKLKPRTRAPHASLSVLVADLENHTGDPLFDETLEPMFNVALEGASFINAYNRASARRLAGKLPNPSNKLDEKTARLVAVSQGISAIVTGSLNNRGTGYKLSINAIDAVTGKNLAVAEVNAANKDEVLLQVPKLTAPIRKALGDTTPESVQLEAAQGSFSASNLEAVHQYSIAMDEQFAGKMEDALKSFSKATELDPNFARAYAGMAAVAGNLGQKQNAAQYAKLAMEHVDRMTERERYRVRGQYYIRNSDWQKCVEEYSELLRQYPADNIGQNNLAFCYAELHNMPKAMEEGQRALQLAPKDAMARMNFSLYSCYATDFQRCEQEAGEVFTLNPSYEKAFLALAYAQTGQNQLSRATETYQKLEQVSARGASLAASGLANLAMYEGRFGEGARMLEKGATADLAAKRPDAAADKFVMLSYAQLLRGDRTSASAAAQAALANSQSVKIRFLAARTFVEAGDNATAEKLAESLSSGVGAESQAYVKLVLGELALKGHDAGQAVQVFGEANNLVDTWIGRFDLGRAYLEAGAFAEADSEFDRCIKRRGEVLELFMDDMPTYSYFPVVYYYQGRIREGLKSPGFADSYRTYLNIRAKSTEDPLVPEIRRRLSP
jgi:serine/threonine protein kinase/tetratricopeptide (TPR) repeat protein